MRSIRTLAIVHTSLFLLSTACGGPHSASRSKKTGNPMLDKYATVRLTTDMSKLEPHEREMIPLLIDAAKQMDAAFWIQAYGDKDVLMASISDPQLKRFAEINYGPWDRLDNNKPFIPGVGEKPKGANFYPANMTKLEFEGYCKLHPDKAKELSALYTMVRRADNGRDLVAIPYSTFFQAQMTGAASKLKAAAELAKDPGLRQYLFMRALALLQNQYQPSDMQWMDMKDNTIDCVIGPIETYEDQMFGQKACFESYVLVKDKEWSKRLAKYAAMLPGLQKGLPVPDQYKRETPGTDSDLNAYDVVYYAGDCNAGSKTIAINLPNDEEVQLKKGSRRLQLKNAMRAKYDQILLPIADELIAKDQRKHITFDAFFGNTMFHEVAHGLGIKDTINGRGSVRDALKEQSSALEEGKADILGLYMVTKLREQGEITDGDIMDNYVTFLAGIFRSVRFGASSAHGRANMLRFNFFEQAGAFSRDDATGRYRVVPDKMAQAVTDLSRKILTLQGDGDYAGVVKTMEEQGNVGPALQADLDRLSTAGIPVDVVFEQGMSVLR